MRELINAVNETIATCIDAQYIRHAKRGKISLEVIEDIYFSYDPQVLLTPVGMSDFLNKIDQATLTFFVAVMDQLSANFSSAEMSSVVADFAESRQNLENLLHQSIIMGPDLAKDRSDIGRYFQSLNVSQKYDLSLFEFVVHRFFVVFHETSLFNSVFKG